MTEVADDQKYYAEIPPDSLGARLAITARDRIYSDFMRVCQPQSSQTVLDVGIGDVEHAAANVLERKYPYSEQLTAAGTSDGLVFQKQFPNVKYRRLTDDKSLPFGDKEFDIATSNAVLEHVGSHHNQLNFIRELHRVAREVFIIVPNRFFPVEHHTSIPLLHYANTTFRLGCKLTGKEEWGREENLILMSRAYLLSLASSYQHVQAGYTGLKMGLLSSNIYLHIKDPI